jgi:hypothetical protein
MPDAAARRKRQICGHRFLRQIRSAAVTCLVKPPGTRTALERQTGESQAAQRIYKEMKGCIEPSRALQRGFSPRICCRRVGNAAQICQNLPTMPVLAKIFSAPGLLYARDVVHKPAVG